MNDPETTALRYIERDPVSRADMLYFLQRGGAEVLSAGETGVLIYDPVSRMHSLSCTDAAAASALVGLIRAPRTVILHEEAYQKELISRLGLRMGNRAHIWAYLKKTPVPLSPDADIRPLGVGDLQLMVDHYHLFTDIDYFTERLQSGDMFGIYVQGRPAGFIGQHSEGCLGMLEIFPEFRRHGLAYELEGYVLNRVLAQGRIPYDEVLIGNEASTGLQRKLGFTPSAQVCSWFSP